MDANVIGEFLFELRKTHSLTQKDIASKCNVSTQAVSKWERGESIPDIAILNRLSNLYSITINEIVNGERNKPRIKQTHKVDIVLLVMSVIVFLAFVFPYVEYRDYLSHNAWTPYIFKGYQLIFNGVTGWQVYLTQAVLLLLFSHLIINIFIISKVLSRTKHITIYTMVSSMALISVTLFGIAHHLIYFFPQFLILLYALLVLVLTIYTGETSTFMKKLKDYKHYKKTSSVPDNLLLEDNLIKSKLLRNIRMSLIAIIILSFISATSLLAAYFNELRYYSYNNSEANFALVIAVVILSLTGLLFSTYKYIGSIYSSQILKVNIVLTVFLLLLIWLAILSPILFITIPLFLIALFVFVSGVKKLRVDSQLS